MQLRRMGDDQFSEQILLWKDGCLAGKTHRLGQGRITIEVKEDRHLVINVC